MMRLCMATLAPPSESPLHAYIEYCNNYDSPFSCYTTDMIIIRM